MLDLIRANGKTAYCFIENLYKGEKIEFNIYGDIESTLQSLESLELKDPLIRKIFDKDIEAQKNSDSFIPVLPAGISGHIEAGASYGMGKKCYAIGNLEKTETLYHIFDKIFLNNKELNDWLSNS